MLLLEYHNRIVEETIRRAADAVKAGGKCDPVDVTACDFGGCTFHCSSDGQSPIINVSLSTRCFAQLKKFGVENRLKNVYGPLLQGQAESTFDVTLKIDLSNAQHQSEAFFRKVALLKRHTLAAPFYTVFGAATSGKGGALAEIRYRAEEAFYLKPTANGCTVIFSVIFRDDDDVLLSKVFLQEFADARKTIRGAPSITFSQKEPPGELQGVQGLVVSDNHCFVSFSIFPEHMAAAKLDRTVDQMLIFRDYLHYHLKCAKAHLHQRMRIRVKSHLQVLNRAKQEDPFAPKEKKLFSGKRMERK